MTKPCPNEQIVAGAVKNDGLSLLQSSVFSRNRRFEVNGPMAALRGNAANPRFPQQKKTRVN